jgi:hypothetical protein
MIRSIRLGDGVSNAKWTRCFSIAMDETQQAAAQRQQKVNMFLKAEATE